MSNFAQAITARDKLAASLGDCETVDIVSREIIRLLSLAWGLEKIVKPHFLLTEAYKRQIREIYNGTNGQKIPAIKQVRTDWENAGNERMGLLEAKNYVEWVCENNIATNYQFVDFMKNIGMYPIVRS